MHDLGQWATESYRISETEQEEESVIIDKKPGSFS